MLAAVGGGGPSGGGRARTHAAEPERKPETYRFAHDSFQDYFTSCYLLHGGGSRGKCSVFGDILSAEEMLVDPTRARFLAFFFEAAPSQSISLKLQGQRLDTETLRRLCGYLSATCSIAELDLDRCGLRRKEHMEMLGDALRCNASLTRLSMRENGISHWGVGALAGGVARHPALVHLDVSNNDFGNNGVRHLCDALRANRSLAHIDIRGNRVGLEGVEMCHRVMAENRTIQQLEVGGVPECVTDLGTKQFLLDNVSKEQAADRRLLVWTFRGE